MQIEYLKVFCDLTESRSFTKTAQLNAVTQSAISQTIGTLERHFKSLLVERSKKNLRLTPEGEVLYDYGKKIMQDYQALQSKLQEIKGVLGGTIHLATIPNFGLYDLPPYLKRFLADCPDVNVKVQYLSAAHIYEHIIGNVVDLGLIAFPEPDPKLDIQPIRKDRLVLASHPQHPVAKLKEVKLKDLGQLRMVGFEPDIPTRKGVDKLLKDKGVKADYVMQFDNTETVKRAVEADLGVAILPENTVQGEVATGTLAAVPLDGNYFRPLAIISKKGKVLSPAMKRFIELLRKPL